MASGLLILRQEQDAGKNESRQNAGGTVAAECQAAMINWLVEQIALKPTGTEIFGYPATATFDVAPL